MFFFFSGNKRVSWGEIIYYSEPHLKGRSALVKVFKISDSDLPRAQSIPFVLVAVGDFQSSPLHYQHSAVAGRKFWGPVYQLIPRLQCKDSAKLFFFLYHLLVHPSRWKTPRERSSKNKNKTKLN